MLINIYEDKIRQHVVKYGMWGIFYLPDPIDKAKSWDLFKNQSIFPLDYVREIISYQKSNKYWACF